MALSQSQRRVRDVRVLVWGVSSLYRPSCHAPRVALLNVTLKLPAPRVGLTPRFGGWNATVSAIVAFSVATALMAWLLPAVDEIPDGFPAGVLWRFRLASIGAQAIMWTTIGLGFGASVERIINPQRALSPFGPQAV